MHSHVSNTHARSDFAVLIPAYNEAENVPDLVRELRNTFERYDLRGSIVLIDDGSQDGTAEVALREAQGWPCFQVVRHRKNMGKTEALLTGAAACEERYLVVYDADMQHRADEIPRFLDKLAEGWDIVTGKKVGNYEKQTVSKIYNGLSRMLFKVPVSDLNSMKAFDRAVLEEVRLRHDWHRFFVVLAYARGFSVTEIDIELFPRRHGVAKYSGKSRIVVGVLDLIAVAFYLHFSRKPMTFFGLAGIAAVLLGFLLGVITIWMRLEGFHPPFGFRPLLFLVMLLETLGFLMFGFGFIAEMLANQQSEIDSLVKDRGRKHA